MAEEPRWRLVSTRLGPPIEMARWLLEQRSIPYSEEAHAPILHAVRSWRNGVDIELPLVLTPEGPIAGINAFLAALDEKCRTGEMVFGETNSERKAAKEAVALFYDKLFWPAVQVYYHFMLNARDTVLKYALDRAPGWQKSLVRLFFGTWQKAMRRAIHREDFDLGKAFASIDEAFEYAESLISDARPFLGGQSPGGADIVFASFAAPLLLPAKFGAPIPDLSEVPPAFREHIEAFRARSGGKLIDQIYAVARPAPQSPAAMPSTRQPLLQRALAPPVVAAAARLVARTLPVLRFRNTTLAFSWRHATELLERDGDFIIEPINGARIRDVSGPFILGMDRSVELFAQREAIYRAARSADTAIIRDILESEPKKLLEAAMLRHGRIDAVNGYARLVAARACSELFGVRGPTEQQLMHAVRSVFHETFLNLASDQNVRYRGIVAGENLTRWIGAEIARRADQSDGRRDILAGLIEEQQRLGLEPKSISWMLAGLMVGSIDTTATSVANIMAEFLRDGGLKAAASHDLDDPRRMLGWCYEALRFRPHNPIILRQAAHATKLGNKRIQQGENVIAVTLTAMQDGAAFPLPSRPNPERPLDRYLHFGWGLHQCVGRNLNAVQIPRLVTELLRYQARGPAKLRLRGPFPDEFVLTLGD